MSIHPALFRVSQVVLGLSLAVGALAQDRAPRPVPRERPQMPNRHTEGIERPPRTPRAQPDGPGDHRVVRTREADEKAPRGDKAPREALPIVQPRPMPRCAERPNQNLWRQRDIMKEIQAMSRRGNIHVNPVDEATVSLTGVANFPAGWIAYGFRVPAGENIHIRLTHGNEGWFRLVMVDKWGGQGEGMLHNMIPTGNPEVKYSNPSKETRAVYVIVDDPGWMSSTANPFTLTITRSWDPAQKKVDDSQVVTGIWARK